MQVNATIPLDIETMCSLRLKSFTITMDGVEHHFSIPYQTYMGCEWDGHETGGNKETDKHKAISCVVEDDAHLQYCATCTMDMLERVGVEGGVVTGLELRTW